MTLSAKHYCVIWAGGKGTRLWPCSRRSLPKQFLDFFGTGRTQLQATYDRMTKVVDPSRIFVTTHHDYVELVRQQLPQLSEEQILAEPVRRNTAPALAWAVERISRLCPNACILATPSDQVVMDEAAFAQAMEQGLRYVEQHPHFLAVGIRPTRPEPGYGYIQQGDKVTEGVSLVKSFTEKPERHFAQVFIDSGEFLWNTGLFLASVQTLRERLNPILPQLFSDFQQQHPQASTEEENAYMTTHFSLHPHISTDAAILEHGENVAVMEANFGWADLGTWHSIYEAERKTEDDNVVVDSDVLMEDCRDNIVKLPKGRLGVIHGLEGFIVAEEDNVLLICKKEDSSSLIRKYVNDIQLHRGNEWV